MFSSRATFDLRQNALTRRFQAKRAAGDRVFDLTVSNPTQVGIDYPGGEILRALQSPAGLQYRPLPAGLPEARQAVADYYATRRIVLDPADIVLTASTSEAYAYLFKLLADPGEAVLVPRPSYPLFDFLCALESVRIEYYQLHDSGGWHLDWEELERSLHTGCRALLLVNPNNPTGSFLSSSDWERLQDLSLQTSTPLIVDEVFCDFPIDAEASRFDPLSACRAPTFGLNGLSKTAGLPQLKLGWIALRGPAEFRRRALEGLEVIADTFLSVASPVQQGLSRLLTLSPRIRDPIRRRLCANYRTLQATLRPTSAHALPVEGGWYATIRLPRIRSEEEWALHLLEAAGVYLHPGYFFGFDDEPYAVVSLLPPSAEFGAGIERLAALLP